MEKNRSIRPDEEKEKTAEEISKENAIIRDLYLDVVDAMLKNPVNENFLKGIRENNNPPKDK